MAFSDHNTLKDKSLKNKTVDNPLMFKKKIK